MWCLLKKEVLAQSARNTENVIVINKLSQAYSSAPAAVRVPGTDQGVSQTRCCLHLKAMLVTNVAPVSIFNPTSSVCLVYSVSFAPAARLAE